MLVSGDLLEVDMSEKADVITSGYTYCRAIAIATGIAVGAVIRIVCKGLGSFGKLIEEGILLGMFDESIEAAN